jgi:uncharacterized protein (TIGR00730 family)
MVTAPHPRSHARLCLFCGANTGARPEYRDEARELGARLARARIGLVYGGGSVGLMQLAAEAALAGGGEVIGVITRQLMAREVGHAGLTALHIVETMHERKALMAKLADGFVVLPGGYGTFDEMCEMLTWNQLRIHVKPVVLVNVAGFFDGFLTQLERAVADGLLLPANRALLAVVDTVGEVLDAASRWRAPAGLHVPQPTAPLP